MASSNERLGMDFVGPFPTSPGGHKYILVIVDYFSKWTEAYATKDQQAITVFEILDKLWIPSKGEPTKLHSDRGSGFIADIIKELSSVYGIEKTETTS